MQGGKVVHVRSAPKMSVNTHESSEQKYYEEFRPLPERDEWPLIPYDGSKAKSAHELLYEVISVTFFAGDI